MPFLPSFVTMNFPIRAGHIVILSASKQCIYSACATSGDSQLCKNPLKILANSSMLSSLSTLLLTVLVFASQNKVSRVCDDAIMTLVASFLRSPLDQNETDFDGQRAIAQSDPLRAGGSGLTATRPLSDLLSTLAFMHLCARCMSRLYEIASPRKISSRLQIQVLRRTSSTGAYKVCVSFSPIVGAFCLRPISILFWKKLSSHRLRRSFSFGLYFSKA